MKKPAEVNCTIERALSPKSHLKTNAFNALMDTGRWNIPTPGLDTLSAIPNILLYKNTTHKNQPDQNGLLFTIATRSNSQNRPVGSFYRIGVHETPLIFPLEKVHACDQG
ncbi:MAG: hypothetical protein AAFW89_01085 [Bacteroidota bacterium]